MAVDRLEKAIDKLQSMDYWEIIFSAQVSIFICT